MECIVCNKQVNEMTLFCDNCGAQLLENKVEVNLETIDEMILNSIYDLRFNEAFEDEIRKAYYLSQIKDQLNGESFSNLEKYFDYFFLRLLYEDEKDRFLDEDFPKQIAKEILLAFTKKTITKKVKGYLKQKYEKDYTMMKIPEEIIKRVPTIYNTKIRDTGKLVKGRGLVKIISEGFVHFITGYLLATFVSGLLVGLKLTSNSNVIGITPERITSYLITNPGYIYIPLLVALIWGVFQGMYDKKVDIIAYLFKKDRIFKRQIRKEIKPLYKSVKRRKVKKNSDRST